MFCFLWSLWTYLDLSIDDHIYQNSHKRGKREGMREQTLYSAGFQQRLR